MDYVGAALGFPVDLGILQHVIAIYLVKLHAFDASVV